MAMNVGLAPSLNQGLCHQAPPCMPRCPFELATRDGAGPGPSCQHRALPAAPSCRTEQNWLWGLWCFAEMWAVASHFHEVPEVNVPEKDTKISRYGVTILIFFPIS